MNPLLRWTSFNLTSFFATSQQHALEVDIRSETSNPGLCNTSSNALRNWLTLASHAQETRESVSFVCVWRHNVPIARLKTITVFWFHKSVQHTESYHWHIEKEEKVTSNKKTIALERPDLHLKLAHFIVYLKLTRDRLWTSSTTAQWLLTTTQWCQFRAPERLATKAEVRVGHAWRKTSDGLKTKSW